MHKPPGSNVRLTAASNVPEPPAQTSSTHGLPGFTSAFNCR